jgi:hypothetical protein
MTRESIARRPAPEGANEIFLDCPMWLIQNSAEEGLPSHIPIQITEAELAIARERTDGQHAPMKLSVM